jgi:hypothetical protein
MSAAGPTRTLIARRKSRSVNAHDIDRTCDETHEPIGAPKPFDMQSETESKGSHSSFILWRGLEIS